MITIPVYNMIILPNISLTFKKDFFDETSASKMREGDKVLFLFQKNEKSRKNLTEEDFYPIGLNGVIESVDDDGDVITGKLRPRQCPLFEKVCTPEDPVGPCMVSSEGACSAAYKYQEI